MPNPSLEYIYMGAIYMFSFGLHYALYNLHIPFWHVASCCPTSLLHPTRRVTLDSIQKNMRKYHVIRFIRPFNMTYTSFVHCLRYYQLYIWAYMCANVLFLHQHALNMIPWY